MKAGNILLLSTVILIPGVAMASEEPNYTILNQTEDFELRRYDPQIVAQTWVAGDQKSASNQGFKRLADYIFGNNTAPSGDSSKISMTAPVMMQPQTDASGKSEKMAMTSPVTVKQDEGQPKDGKWRVQFIIPSQYTMQSLPKPNNSDITLTELPVKTYGVVKFSGLVGSKKLATKTEELQSWMQSQNLNVIGTAQLARYDPPWTPPFMRRNEIMIEYQAK